MTDNIDIDTNKKEEQLNTIAMYYPAPNEPDKISFHTLSMVARDRAGTLARIIGFFSARNYNIDSIAASNIDSERGLSSITLTTRGSDKVLEQICKQLERLVNIYYVSDVTGSKDRVLRELALIKIKAEGKERIEALSIAHSFHANIVDASKDTFIIEMTGAPQKVSTFIDILRPLGVIEVIKSGPAGMINTSFSCLTEIIEDE